MTEDKRVWKVVPAGRRLRCALLGVAGIATVLVAAPASAQTGFGGRQWMAHAEDGDGMSWGAAAWRGPGTVQLPDAGGLTDRHRTVLIERLRSRGGAGLYMEVSGETPGVVRLAGAAQRSVFLRIDAAPRGGHTRGHVEVREPTDDSTPVLFLRNNVQQEIVVEVPPWLEHVTIVVNGRVLLDAVRPGAY